MYKYQQDRELQLVVMCIIALGKGYKSLQLQEVTREIPSSSLDCKDLSTRHKGEIAQLKILLKATEKGFCCSRPIIEGCRYDLIVDDGCRLFKAQCKYSNVEKHGAIRISLEKFSGSVKAGKGRTYTADEIDVIIAYIFRLDKILWLPSCVWDKKHAIHIRVSPSRNNQTKGILLLDQYIW